MCSRLQGQIAIVFLLRYPLKIAPAKSFHLVHHQLWPIIPHAIPNRSAEVRMHRGIGKSVVSEELNGFTNINQSPNSRARSSWGKKMDTTNQACHPQNVQLAINFNVQEAELPRWISCLKATGHEELNLATQSFGSCTTISITELE